MNSRNHEPHELAALAVQHGEELGERDLPSIAILIPTLDGWHDLEGCLGAILEQDYPKNKVRVVVTDNGSRDGTARRVRARFPQTELVTNRENLGFSVAVNQAADLASAAEIYIFVNNDVRMRPGFLRAIVAPIVRGECAATSAKMLSWDGNHIDHAGGGCNFQGIGIAYGYGEPASDKHDFSRKCLFACGGAMAMDAAIFQEVGKFDEDYFAYYEDLDLGWRTWLAGHEVHYCPAAVCIHRHSGTSRRFIPEVLRVLQARNPFLTAYKNYEEQNLDLLLPTLLMLYMKRLSIMARLGEAAAYRVNGRSHLFTSRIFWRLWTLLPIRKRGLVGRLGIADLVGLNDFLRNTSAWRMKRAKVQALRKRSDGEIFPLFLRPLWCVEKDPEYAELQRDCIEAYHVSTLFAGLDTLRQEPRG